MSLSVGIVGLANVGHVRWSLARSTYVVSGDQIVGS